MLQNSLVVGQRCAVLHERLHTDHAYDIVASDDSVNVDVNLVSGRIPGAD